MSDHREYALSGMHCGACVQRVRRALEGVAGVRAARVTLQPPRATVEFVDGGVDEEALRGAVAGAGDYTLGERVGERERGAEGVGGDGAATESRGTRESPGTREGHSAEGDSSYRPLAILGAYLVGVSVLPGVASGSLTAHVVMANFMAGFFLAFSFFKLLDLRGFVGSFRQYDLIARAWPAWGWAYPFVELALGVGYLMLAGGAIAGGGAAALHAVTLAVMGVSGVGVVVALRSGRVIQCACLGTVIRLPLGTVTLIEDFGMAGMAAVMLVMAAVGAGA